MGLCLNAPNEIHAVESPSPYVDACRREAAVGIEGLYLRVGPGKPVTTTTHNNNDTAGGEAKATFGCPIVALATLDVKKPTAALPVSKFARLAAPGNPRGPQ